MMKRLIPIFLLVSATCHARDLGVVGKTFPIKERDAQEEVMEKAMAVDWKKTLAKAKPEKYRPPNAILLPRATKDDSFLVDMTHTLDIDIPDGKGGVLYPKGYSYNPLDFMSYKKTLVVIDATDPDQVAWFMSSPYRAKNDVSLLITGGNFLEATKKLDQQAFYTTDLIRDRFQLRAVPSIIKQKFRMMEVIEVKVQHQAGRGK